MNDLERVLCVVQNVDWSYEQETGCAGTKAMIEASHRQRRLLMPFLLTLKQDDPDLQVINGPLGCHYIRTSAYMPGSEMQVECDIRSITEIRNANAIEQLKLAPYMTE